MIFLVMGCRLICILAAGSILCEFVEDAPDSNAPKEAAFFDKGGLFL